MSSPPIPHHVLPELLRWVVFLVGLYYIYLFLTYSTIWSLVKLSRNLVLPLSFPSLFDPTSRHPYSTLLPKRVQYLPFLHDDTFPRVTRDPRPRPCNRESVRVPQNPLWMVCFPHGVRIWHLNVREMVSTSGNWLPCNRNTGTLGIKPSEIWTRFIGARRQH